MKCSCFKGKEVYGKSKNILSSYSWRITNANDTKNQAFNNITSLNFQRFQLSMCKRSAFQMEKAQIGCTRVRKRDCMFQERVNKPVYENTGELLLKSTLQRRTNGRITFIQMISTVIRIRHSPSGYKLRISLKGNQLTNSPFSKQ